MMKGMHYWVFGEKSSSGKKERTEKEPSLASLRSYDACSN